MLERLCKYRKDLLDTIISFQKALKGAKRNSLAIYDDVLTNFNTLWANNNLFCQMSNTRIMWDNCAPNVGLVDHA